MHSDDVARRFGFKGALVPGVTVFAHMTRPLVERYGGRSVVKAELARPPAETIELPAELDGLSLRFESDRPLEEVGRLSSAGVIFQTLEVARPDLETVFLTLTGRSLRD